MIQEIETGASQRSSPDGDQVCLGCSGGNCKEKAGGAGRQPRPGDDSRFHAQKPSPLGTPPGLACAVKTPLVGVKEIDGSEKIDGSGFR